MNTPPRPHTPPPEVRDQFLAYREAWDGSPVCSGPFVPAREVAQLATGAAVRREPFAAVRLGPAEGCCLFRDTRGFYDLAEFSQAAAMSFEFGPRHWLPDEMDAMTALVTEGIHEASVITAACRPEDHAALVAQPPDTGRDMAAFVGATWMQHWLASQDLPSRRPVYRDANLHIDLLPSLRGICTRHEIAVVGSQGADFPRRLAAAWGATLAGQVHLPAPAHGEPLFPEALPRLREEVRRVSAPGVVVLVGAGLLAKPLCAEAAENGAVALDLGAALDVLAGRAPPGSPGAALAERWRI